MEVSGQLHALAWFTPWEIAPGFHWIGGWVRSRTDLDGVEWRKFLPLPGLKLRPLGHPAHRYTDCAIPAPRAWRLACHLKFRLLNEADQNTLFNSTVLFYSFDL
jgi:hypothetical protein